MKADDRSFDFTPINTEDLPPTPTRDRNIAAQAWNQAPPALLDLGERTAYKRRLGTWLLWRNGLSRGPATYLAIDSSDLDRHCSLTIEADGTHHGIGPSGTIHDRFRSWKEDLLGRLDPPPT